MSDSHDRVTHWETVHATREPTAVSWYQPVPRRSLEWTAATGLALDAPLLDVGAGASTLVDHWLTAGHADVSMLDIASAALERSRARLGVAAPRVEWIVSDVTTFRPTRRYALWHDRAVLHFLTDALARDMYLASLRAALMPGGDVILATFGPDGPLRCSGLPVQRYGVDELSALLGPAFTLRRDALDEHVTPSGGRQQFQYGWWRRQRET